MLPEDKLTLKVDTVILEKIKLALIYLASKHLRDAKVDVVKLITEDIKIQIEGFLWGKQFQQKHVKFPQNWWEAFKEHWFPVWILKRYPVKYTHYTFSLAEVYPEFKPALTNEKLIILHRLEQNIRCEE